ARFDELRRYLDEFSNLFLVGRNGMHKYNNQDHSMLTAMAAVDNILSGRVDKENIWSINTEQEYHEDSHSDSQSSYAEAVSDPDAGSEPGTPPRHELVHK